MHAQQPLREEPERSRISNQTTCIQMHSLLYMDLPPGVSPDQKLTRLSRVCRNLWRDALLTQCRDYILVWTKLASRM